MINDRSRCVAKYAWFLIFITFSISLYAFKQEKITIMGTGYVGLVTGACLADMGHTVICVDVDEHKIHQLNNGHIPIFEPDLELLIKTNVSKNQLSFTTDRAAAITASDIIFVTVGTPFNEKTGDTDLSIVENAIREIAQHLNSYKIIVIKSTVPIGTGVKLKEFLVHTLLIPENKFDIVSNPEFLREGSAIYDFKYPDRIVVGCLHESIIHRMKNMYEPLAPNVAFISTDPTTAETIKYACNAFLAIKICFINEIAHICKATNGNINIVAHGIGRDHRINPYFLKPGPGFGGSCLPKDIKGLCKKIEQLGIEAPLLKAILPSNEIHKNKASSMLTHIFKGNLHNKKIALLGLSFKSNTDDVRFSPAIDLIQYLQKNNAYISAYDPAANNNMKALYPDLHYCTSYMEAIKNADCFVILTEWKEFESMDLKEIAHQMHTRIAIDMRNILNSNELKKLNFEVYGIGV